MSGSGHRVAGFAAGGTGGHLVPAIAIADAMVRLSPSCEILFFATSRPIDRRLIQAHGYRYIPVLSYPLPRSVGTDTLLFPFRLMLSVLFAMEKLRSFRVSVVVLAGGYPSVPIGLAGYLMGRPVFLQEQNSIPGVASRVISRLARMTFIGFPDSAKYLSGRLVFTGNPIPKREISGTREEILASVGLSPQKKTVLVTGGSQGASSLNRVVSQLVGKTEWQFIWQTGRTDLERYLPLSRQERSSVYMFDFSERIADFIFASDLVVARAGALTLAEVASLGKPAVLVPYPYATGGHQLLNAQAIASSGGAVVIRDEELTPQLLKEKVAEILFDKERLDSMSEAIRSFAHPDAAERIANIILEEIE
ncbi:UDP-N-acetylglucosamine--N-acetylmuramyl-(pentapeptide) pyrophosphoryl-undecaprenol N-acetylglucosamine transferase [bacterium]|nr:UDP-N-acetylglucosamine--N-acetylmuramyl-(pentapeptide) pyrophosphoryl-undecaprenol N-acetylglucosamine transferase [bacterium]